MLDISIIIYFNDILIFLKIKKEYVKYIKKVLIALAKKNLRINLKKYKWHKKKLSFLNLKLKKTEFEYR